MPMDRSRYPRNWNKVSRTLRRIAGYRCEWCGRANGTPLPSGATYKKGRRRGMPVPVIVTVAHLGVPYPDGRPGDSSDKHDLRHENLAVLCAKCHLAYDLEHHIKNAKRTKARKKREAALASGQLRLIDFSLGDQCEHEGLLSMYQNESVSAVRLEHEY